MKERFKKVTTEPLADYMLGIRLDRGTDENGMRYVELGHESSIERIAETAQATKYRRTDTPMDHTLRLRKKQPDDEVGEVGDTDGSKYIPPYKYASVLGAVMYIANMTRPDIVTAINKLSRYVSNPGKSHY